MPNASAGQTRSRSQTESAVALHETVNPSRWCITFADLRFFECEVQRVIQDGTFHEDFGEYGPSIYAVNEHYIKPVTAAAGKMSWALMMNPYGLDCDLFVTHAWQEDVFEFTEKVLASWPWRARHAWCCMLANPQNLDIAALLQSPSSSPFALALHSSKYMLVVPNRHKSVYTRLWCGYEAYLAFQSNKIIRTATPPICRPACLSWLRMLPALLIGIVIGFASRVCPFEWFLQVIATTKFLALLASLVSQNCGHNKLCLIANNVGLATGAAFLSGYQLSFSASPCMRASILGYFVLAEVDRVSLQAEQREADALKNQYPGSVRHALCSVVQDENQIRNEIGDQVEEVDKVIQVLMKAGLTSDALRVAYLQGVELRHSGFFQLAVPVTVLGPWLLINCWNLVRSLEDGEAQVNGFRQLLRVSSIVARLTFITLLCRSSIDERCFMLNAMAKMVAPMIFCYWALRFWESHSVSYNVCLGLSSCIYHLSFVVVLFFAALGIRGTLKLPCGTFLTQAFLSRIIWCENQSDLETNELLSQSDDSDFSRSS